MIDLRTIDELTRKLGESLPPGLVQKSLIMLSLPYFSISWVLTSSGVPPRHW